MMEAFERWLWLYSLSHLSSVTLPNGRDATTDILSNWSAAKKALKRELPQCSCVEAHEPFCPQGG